MITPIYNSPEGWTEEQVDKESWGALVQLRVEK